MTRKRVTLYAREAETSVSIVAYLTDDGAVVVEGFDVGAAPEAFWGDDDYEYFVHVEADHAGSLLRALLAASGAPPAAPTATRVDEGEQILTLLEQRFGGDAGAVGSFLSFCREHAVPAEFSSWI